MFEPLGRRMASENRIEQKRRGEKRREEKLRALCPGWHELGVVIAVTSPERRGTSH
jgi:hypothetical protein